MYFDRSWEVLLCRNFFNQYISVLIATLFSYGRFNNDNITTLTSTTTTFTINTTVTTVAVYIIFGITLRLLLF